MSRACTSTRSSSDLPLRRASLDVDRAPPLGWRTELGDRTMPRGRWMAALCVLAGLAACEDKPQDSLWADYVKQQQAGTPAASSSSPSPATSASTGLDNTCPDASQTPDG